VVVEVAGSAVTSRRARPRAAPSNCLRERGRSGVPRPSPRALPRGDS
jgi:hypothetical protein